MLTPPTRAHHRRADDWRRSDGGLWLPGAADVPRVAGDPMRGAGMVRRGMGMGFEPAGCCCGDEGCGTYYSMEYDYTGQSILVDGSGIGNYGWGDCLWMNDAYELTVASGFANYPFYCQVTWSLTVIDPLRTITVIFRIRPEANTREIIVSYQLRQTPSAQVNFWKEEAGASLYQNTDGATWQIVDTYFVSNCTVSSGAVDLTLGV
jgi:hypothetical protein